MKAAGIIKVAISWEFMKALQGSRKKMQGKVLEFIDHFYPWYWSKRSARCPAENINPERRYPLIFISILLLSIKVDFHRVIPL